MARQSKAKKCLDKFLFYFPKGFRDPKYISWERGYKEDAHRKWEQQMNKKACLSLVKLEHYNEFAATAIRIESRTNLLFSFEKMALRDAVKTQQGAMHFAKGLCNFLHGKGSEEKRFNEYVEVISELPRKQTRVLTWPLLTVFPFIAHPEKHIFLKPNVTKAAAEAYGFQFDYKSRPTWEVYQNYRAFAARIKSDLKEELDPRDMIDLQSFMWVLGSSEYPDDY